MIHVHLETRILSDQLSHLLRISINDSRKHYHKTTRIGTAAAAVGIEGERANLNFPNYLLFPLPLPLPLLSFFLWTVDLACSHRGYLLGSMSVPVTEEVLSSLRIAKVHKNHTRKITSLDIDWSGRHCISVGEDDTLNLYDCESGK